MWCQTLHRVSAESATCPIHRLLTPDSRQTWAQFESFMAAFGGMYFTGGIKILYSTGLYSGGPAALWSSWVVTMVGACITAASLAEICSSIPLSGSIYLWAAGMCAESGALSVDSIAPARQPPLDLSTVDSRDSLSLSGPLQLGLHSALQPHKQRPTSSCQNSSCSRAPSLVASTMTTSGSVPSFGSSQKPSWPSQS